MQTPDSTFQRSITIDHEQSAFVNDGNDPDLLPWGQFLPLGSAPNGVGGQHHKAKPGRPGDTLTVQWPGMPAAPAYDHSVPR